MTPIHHAGITVSDLETSMTFYADLLGGKTLGPYERSGPRIDAVTGHPGVVVRQGFVRPPGDGTMVELLEYRGGPDVALDPDNAHVGAVHVAITVDDLDAVLSRLRDSGTAAVSEPITASAPMSGFRCVYVLDPDRVRVELVEPPAEVS